MLKLLGVTQISLAEDGREALELVKSSRTTDDTDPIPYDLILMDIQMPNMDGLESTRLIRALGYTRPIVALTAYAEQNNIDDCYAAGKCLCRDDGLLKIDPLTVRPLGMNHFIPKPLKRPALQEGLAKLCAMKHNDPETTP